MNDLGGARQSVRDLAAQTLAKTRFPAVVVELASGRVVAASASASDVLDRPGADLLDQPFESFTAEAPLTGRELFRTGQITGFEAVRHLRDDPRTSIRLWVHKFDHVPSSEYLLVVLFPDGSDEDVVDRPPSGPAIAGPIAGATNENLEIVQLTPHTTVQGTPEDLLGRSVLSLLAPDDRAPALVAVAEAVETGRGVTAYVDLLTVSAEGTSRTPAELLILPLTPAPSCFFALVPAASDLPRARLSEDLAGVLSRLTQGMATAGGRARIAHGRRIDLSELTPREHDVLNGLLGGKRVDVIAKTLFLSPSTVRTHVSSLERKLGVSSQQEIIALLARSHRSIE